MDDIILDIYFTIPSGYFNPLPSSPAPSTLLARLNNVFSHLWTKKVIKLSFNRYTMATLKNWVTIYLQLVDTLFWEVASYLNSFWSALRRKHFAFWHCNWFPNLQYVFDMTFVRFLSMGCDTLHNRYLQLFNQFASIKAYRAFIFPLTIVNTSSPVKIKSPPAGPTPNLTFVPHRSASSSWCSTSTSSSQNCQYNLWKFLRSSLRSDSTCPCGRGPNSCNPATISLMLWCVLNTPDG